MTVKICLKTFFIFFSITLLISLVGCDALKQELKDQMLSSDVENKKDVVAPGEVTGLHAIAGDGQATLYWTIPSDDDFSYTLIAYLDQKKIASTQPTSDEAKIKTTSDNPTRSYTILNLLNDQEIVITLQTVDQNENVSKGVSINVTPVDLMAPDKIKDVTATIKNSDIVITWDNTTGYGTDYSFIEIRYSKTLVPSTNQLGELLTSGNNFTSAVLYQPSANTTYHFAVFCVDKSGNYSDASLTSITSPQLITPLATTQDVPTVSAFLVQLQDHQLHLSWTNPVFDNFYQVEVRYKFNGYPESLSDGYIAYQGNSVSCTMSNLKAGFSYFFYNLC